MMKKSGKMSLNKETLVRLSAAQLQVAVGGAKKTEVTIQCSEPCSAPGVTCISCPTGTTVVGCGISQDC